MNTKSKIASVIAAAAAVAFTTVYADSAVTQPKEKTVFCYGINACKGQSECSTAEAVCKGENACKGQGYLYKTAAECKKAGGTVKVPPLVINPTPN